MRDALFEQGIGKSLDEVRSIREMDSQARSRRTSRIGSGRARGGFHDGGNRTRFRHVRFFLIRMCIRKSWI